MKKNILAAYSILFLIIFSNSYSMNNEQIEDLRKEAIKLMNSGKFEEAIQITDSALKIKPESTILLYDKALAYYKLENYQEAIDILTPLKDRPDVFEQIYQILGNSYDFTAKKYTAIDIYNEGLRKFPNSGRLYMELGIAELGNENTNLAISYFERGIMAQPDYPNNYYHLSKVLEEGNYYIQAIIYAETFMNLVRNENKFREINKLLFDIYGKLIASSTDNKIRNVYSNFEKNYEKIIQSAVNQEKFDKKNISIKTINDFRFRVLELWFEKYPDSFQSKVLIRQKQLFDSDLFEAYNYWLMSDGELDEFKIWIEQNYKDYDELILWLQKNRLIITGIIDIYPKI